MLRAAAVIVLASIVCHTADTTTLERCWQLGVGNNRYVCMLHELNLWADGRGYDAQRMAAMLQSHRGHQAEIELVLEYCNRLHRQPEQPELWAQRAYNCATTGPLGLWLPQYLLQQLHSENELK